jgi:hypothetical protein
MPPRVVNIMPFAMSGETGQDSEPNIAVNPENPRQIAASAFTPDPMNGPNAPIYVSTDGGENWALNLIVPSQDSLVGTGDITLRFVNRGGRLYAGILRRPSVNNLRLDVLRTANFTAAAPMTVLVDRDTTPGPDQPYIQAATALGGGAGGRDRVFVGNNDRPGAAGGRTSTVDYHLDAANSTPPPPSGFSTRVVETRNTASQDGFACRPALHWDGTVYVAFLAWRSSGTNGWNSDVCIVRDDNWAQGANPFQALVEPPAPAGDGGVGMRVVRGIVLPFSGNFGQQRRGSSLLSIAVSPRNSDTVYLAWGDSVGAANTPTLHVRRSLDAGVTWSADIRTVQNALNPALAINSRGKVGFLYQQLAGTAPNQTWDTRLELTTDNWGSVENYLLATTPSNAPAPAFQPYLGDYVHLLAVGKHFYGVFSANNRPNNANFPQGVRYQRAANFATQQLFQTNGVTPVAVSIDPFFVRQTELAASADFYVRDWTDSPTSGDNGVEPSGNPWFFVHPDVWNRQSDDPGGFDANDRPAGEDARMGPGIHGRNWAFARVRRNESGVSATVTLHFLVSPLGTGSNFQNAGTTADPTLSFAAAQLVRTLPDGYRWQLDPTATSHVCLAAEISTPQDPLLPPSLLGRAPGWPETDMSVLLDNNKAQRNLHPVAGGPSGAVGAYGLVHNAATQRREMRLLLERPDGAPLPPIKVVGGQGKVDRRRGTVTLPEMGVGENRWLEFVLSPEDRKSGLLVTVLELVGHTPVNGFALEPRMVSDTDIGRRNLRLHASACWRLAAGFGIHPAERQAEEAARLADDATLDSYLAWLAKAAEPLRGWVTELVQRSKRGDPFAIRRAASALATAARERAEETTSVHATFLYKLDSFLTMLQKDEGDPADILQVIAWHTRLARSHPKLSKIKRAEGLLERSDAFVTDYSRRRIRADDYPAFLREELPSLAELAAAAGVDRDRLDTVSDALGDVAALQAAHRQLLAEIEEAAG